MMVRLLFAIFFLHFVLISVLSILSVMLYLDIYKSGKKSISMKEAKRRREWGAGKDPLQLAAMPWPVFPRNSVTNVLSSLLEEVIKVDKEHLGIFSVPVPKDQFPEYYELIKKPMDYGKFLDIRFVICCP